MNIAKLFTTERLLLRCWRNDDAEKLLPLLESNVDHLQEWIPERIYSSASITELNIKLEGFEKDIEDE